MAKFKNKNNFKIFWEAILFRFWRQQEAFQTTSEHLNGLNIRPQYTCTLASTTFATVLSLYAQMSED